jgi:hypothetical protein
LQGRRIFAHRPGGEQREDNRQNIVDARRELARHDRVVGRDAVGNVANG